MAKVIGYVILQLKRYVIDFRGKETLDKILDECKPETKDTVSAVVFSGQMYELGVFEDFLDHFEKQLGKGEIQKFAETIAHAQLKGLYGIVAKFLTVEKLLSRAQSMWDKQFSQGKLNIDVKNNKYTITLIEFPTTDAHKVSFMYYFRELLEIATGKTCISSAYKIIDSETTEFILQFED